jgi:hypothetical protein
LTALTNGEIQSLKGHWFYDHLRLLLKKRYKEVQEWTKGRRRRRRRRRRKGLKKGKEKSIEKKRENKN